MMHDDCYIVKINAAVAICYLEVECFPFCHYRMCKDLTTEVTPYSGQLVRVYPLKKFKQLKTIPSGRLYPKVSERKS